MPDKILLNAENSEEERKSLAILRGIGQWLFFDKFFGGIAYFKHISTAL